MGPGKAAEALQAGRTARTKHTPAAVAAGAVCLATVLAACGQTSLNARPAPAIAATALANLRTARTVHYTAALTDGADTVAMDITVVTGSGCTGMISQTGKSASAYEFRRIGTQTWVRLLHGTKATGPWLRVSPADAASAAGVAPGICDIASTVATAISNAGPLVKHGMTRIGAQDAIELAAPNGLVDVADTDRPVPLRISTRKATTSGAITLDRYNAPVELVPPPAIEAAG